MDEQAKDTPLSTDSEENAEVVENPVVEPQSAEPIVAPEMPETELKGEPENGSTPKEAELPEEITPVPEAPTAQMGGNEPLPDSKEVLRRRTEPEPKVKLGLLRQMAQATIQLRIQKKLVKVMGLFAKQTEITNDDVEKLLHVSDATDRKSVV